MVTAILFPNPPAHAQNGGNIVDRLDKALGVKLPTEFNNKLLDFVQNDIKFQNYFRNKFNYSPMIPLNILSYSRKTVEKLYEFYSRKIIFMNKNLKFGLKGTEYITSFIKKLMNKTGIIKPTSQRELISFLKPYDEGNKKFKNEDEYYQKILSVK